MRKDPVHRFEVGKVFELDPDEFIDGLIVELDKSTQPLSLWQGVALLEVISVDRTSGTITLKTVRK